MNAQVPFATVRNWVADAFRSVGEVVRLIGNVAKNAVRHPSSLLDVVSQLQVIGVESLSVVILTAIFSSLVMTVQFSVQMARFGAKEYVGNVVAVSLVRELGPVLTALMVGGRVGAGITAELGSMNVTEQLDAMRSMGADPIRSLAVPRVFAGILALPLLTIIANALGMLAAIVMAALDGSANLSFFYNAVIRSVTVSDLLGGIVKTFFFGLFITAIACQRGLTARGGTVGVGRATTQTVVTTSLVTLISDFVLTKILLTFGL